LLYNRFSLYALTKIQGRNELKIYEEVDSKKILSIFDGDELIYEKGMNYDLTKLCGNNLINCSPTNDSASGVAS
jgi:hypothetical protein